MKFNIYFLLLTLLSSQQLTAQKEDYIWTLGYLPNVPEQKFGGSMLNFHHPDSLVSYYPVGLQLTPCAVISSPSGRLQAYSGGCQIANGIHDIMENGNDINEGEYADFYCDFQGYPSINTVLLLNTLWDSINYRMFHIRIGIPNSSLYSDFLSSTVTIDAEHPDGIVTNKNTTILNDTFSNHLTAVRHGNGRDWWVVAHKDRGNGVFMFRYTPEGISEIKTQNIGQIWNQASFSGQSVFSPDGRLYARASPYNYLEVFDFDRCAGEFSNPRFVDMPDTTPYACGVAFSPNSRYLYLTTGLQLHQYDVEATDLEASRILIDTFDWFVAPFPTTFYQMRLAPNNQIYMLGMSGVYYMHTIHQPDQPGTLCDFRQHDLELPTYSDIGLPNVPFFRLYDQQGSPCDTLGIDGPMVSVSPVPGDEELRMQLSPNPTSGTAQLTFRTPYTGSLLVTDQFGRVVLRRMVQAQSAVQLEAAELPNGLYWIHAVSPTGEHKVLKMIIMR